MTGRCAKQCLLIGSMNVDVALLGVGVTFIQTRQPKYPRENQILIATLRGDLPGSQAALEDSAWGRIRRQSFH